MLWGFGSQSAIGRVGQDPSLPQESGLSGEWPPPGQGDAISDILTVPGQAPPAP